VNSSNPKVTVEALVAVLTKAGAVTSSDQNIDPVASTTSQALPTASNQNPSPSVTENKVPAKPVRRNKDGTPRKKPKKAKPTIPKNEGYTYCVKLRLDTTPWQEQLLKSYCGASRATYNTILYHSKVRYNQRLAEVSYGIPKEQLTELVPLGLVDLQNFVAQHKEQWFWWHKDVSKFSFDTGVRNAVKAYANFFAGRTRYPKYKKKPVNDVTADLSVSMTDITAKWLTPTGSHINLPIAKGLWKSKNNPEGMRPARRAVVGNVKVAGHDTRAKRMAKLIYSGRATVQEVTYSYSGGYWWASVRLRVRKESLPKKVRRTAKRQAQLTHNAGWNSVTTETTPTKGNGEERHCSQITPNINTQINHNSHDHTPQDVKTSQNEGLTPTISAKIQLPKVPTTLENPPSSCTEPESTSKLTPNPTPSPHTHLPNRTIGGNLGIDAAFGSYFAVLSRVIPGITDESGKILAPKILRNTLDKLAAAQRDLARTTTKSNRHKTALKKVQKLHGQVAAQRKSWLGELSTVLVGMFDKIVVEDLNLKALAKRKKGKNGRRVFSFGASVGDNGWGMFIKMLEEKAKLFGVVFVKASRWFPSSKTCSECGVVKAKLPLSVRVFECEHCGLVLDRDVNAAVNLEQYKPSQGKRKVIFS